MNGEIIFVVIFGGEFVTFTLKLYKVIFLPSVKLTINVCVFKSEIFFGKIISEFGSIVTKSGSFPVEL